MADGEGDQRRDPWREISERTPPTGQTGRFLVGTRPSIRFEDKERGLRGLVKLLFDARRARQKVLEAKQDQNGHMSKREMR